MSPESISTEPMTPWGFAPRRALGVLVRRNAGGSTTLPYYEYAIASERVPRDSFVARFTPPRAGTFVYHTHVNESRQQLAGLAGALVGRMPIVVKAGP